MLWEVISAIENGRKCGGRLAACVAYEGEEIGKTFFQQPRYPELRRGLCMVETAVEKAGNGAGADESFDKGLLSEEE